MNAVEVGKRIISLREEHDLGQKDLAQILSVRVSSVSNWECGRNKPNKVIINKIKKQFNYDISNENSNNNNLGKKIKTIRLERGLNMREFGEKINNSSDSLVSRWEKGHSIPRQDRLKKIADFANITVEELMQETEESPHISVGRTIRSIRLKHGMSMTEFGKLIDNVKSGVVSNWENGKQIPNKLRLKKIAKLGNITVDELLDITNYQELYELEKERNSLLEQEIKVLKEQLNLLNKKDTSTKVSK